MHKAVIPCLLGLGLGACTHPNVADPGTLHGPAAPYVSNRYNDPYAAYGSTPVIWKPAIATRSGTIVKPTDPVDQAERPDYEHAPWSVEHRASQAGTF
ncbi:hypothetical protein [Asaia sp. VD9]|uniref:hypothetical protein n=1 Tax=Asaia sp. VD9 TaxID=3081235 RepID=UPI00301AAF30